MSQGSEAELRRRLAEGSVDPDDFRELAHLLAERGQTEAALDVLEPALARPLESLARAQIVADLGWLLFMGRREPTRVRALAEEGLALLAGERDTAEALFVRAMLETLLAYQREEADAPAAVELAGAALRTFDRLFAEYPDWEEQQAWLEAARLAAWLGDGDRAVSLTQRFLEVELDESRRLDGLLTLAEGHRLAGRFPEAETVAAEALRLAEGHPEMRHAAGHQLGLIQRERGRPTEARRSFEQALSALDAHPTLREDAWWRRALHGRLAEVYVEVGEPQKAAAAWRDLLGWYAEAEPERARVLGCLGDALNRAGALGEARAAYEAAVAVPGASEEDRAEARVLALWSVGRLRHQAGEYEAATRAFEPSWTTTGTTTWIVGRC